MTDFKEVYNNKKSIIENYINEDLQCQKCSYKTVLDAMKYSACAGGKRIRPVLLMSAYEIFKDDSELVLPFCAAIEYIHTYSLIHDDLPAMDNDNLRRGMPTCHIKFSEAIAILAGDALLNYAYEKMAETVIPYGIEAMSEIAKAAGKSGMIGGQIIDIENEGKKIDLNLLNELHALKTGALIRVACKAGAILGGAAPEEAELLGEFGSLIGMSFQIKDDILDKTSSAEELGKPVGSDEKNNKTTYLTHFSIEECEDIIKQLTERANKIIDSFGERGEFLKELARELTGRNN